MNRTLIALIFVFIGFIAGNVSGFLLGVLSTKAGQQFVKDIVTTEQKAHVDKPQELKGRFYTLRYPGNWKVDRDDEDFDIDHLFTLDSPGSSFVQVLIVEGDTETRENVRTQVDAMIPKLIHNPVRTEFNKWGSYNGTGVELKGRLMGVGKGGIRIFSHAHASHSFTITEFYFDEDLAMTSPGFKLIEDSFAFVKAEK